MRIRARGLPERKTATTAPPPRDEREIATLLLDSERLRVVGYIVRITRRYLPITRLSCFYLLIFLIWDGKICKTVREPADGRLTDTRTRDRVQVRQRRIGRAN